MKSWLSAAGVASACLLLSHGSASAQPSEIRSVTSLAQGWRFRQADTLAGAEAPDFPDTDWQPVSVPHTWNRVGFYTSDPRSHLNRADTVNKVRGVGWYRLAFTPDIALRGRRAWLQFDAASRIADVWLNGVRLGEHRGGFSRFRLDATAAIKPGARNLLAVRVDNNLPKEGGPTADVLPLTGDFFVHGGLYRPVSLIATDAVHVDMLDSGGSGVYATTRAISGGRASVDVRARLRNDAARPVRATAAIRLLDAAGKVAAERVLPVTLAPGTTREVSTSLDVTQAHLWQGTADPYLHVLSVEVRAAGGAVFDRIEQPYGIRQMRFDAAQGFLLNGKPYRLHGTGLHQDREGKGWAIDATDVEADVAQLREMGVNTIRLTHYQHGQPIHDLADRYGLVLWDEVPLVSAWTLGRARTATPGLLANARQQLRELIRQNYNHASVATWSIANEVDFGNSLPEFLTGGTGTPPDPAPILAELGPLAKAEDPSRPTALATCCEGRLFTAGVEVPITATAADLGGANRYFGWYYGKPEDLDAHLDALHARRPEQPLTVTEYGAGGATTIHTDNVLGGPVDMRGRAQPEEYESFVHEGNWAVLARKPYLGATWVWNSYDFASTVRHEGDAEDLNTKGLMTFDRKVKKDAYFFYKANWTTTPTVYVTGRRYVDRAYPVTDVRVYSNAPSTELVLNGRSLGVRAACANAVCVWKDVRLAAGDNAVVARGRFADGPVEDRVDWRLAPDAARTVRIDSGALVAAPANAGRFGSDNFFDGGAGGTADTPGSYSGPPKPAAIAGTPDRAIAATYREGSFGYRVPVANGRHTVTLTFVEPTAAAGERVFDVTANGRRAVAGLDIAKEAGAKLLVLRRSFAVVARDGVIDLRFVPVRGKAIVSAVEIAPADGAR